MSTNVPSLRIGIWGSDSAAGQAGRGCGLWPPGYAAALRTVGAEPVLLPPYLGCGGPGGEALAGLHGLLLLGHDRPASRQLADEENLCRWCQARALPLLGIDRGMHALNATFGGSLFLDLARELPEALKPRRTPIGASVDQGVQRLEDSKSKRAA